MILLDFLVELFQSFELGREAAFGGCVDYEDDFVAEIGEGVGLPFFCLQSCISRRSSKREWR